jgi:hypothetical protein
MLVRALRKHRNPYGKTFEKRPGDKYEHPSPDFLIANSRRRTVKSPG